MQSLFATARLCGASLAMAYGGQALLAVCVLGTVVAQAWRRPRVAPHGGEVAAMAAASMLCTPYVMDYDLAIAGVPLAWLASRAADQGWLPYEKLGAGLVFLWPLIARMAGMEWDLPIGPLVLACAFVLVCRRVWHDTGAPEAVSC